MSRKSLSSTEAYRGVFSRFLHSLQMKLLLYTEVAQLAANPSRESLETFHPSEHDHFQPGGLPEAALRHASHRHAMKLKSQYDHEAHDRIAVGAAQEVVEQSHLLDGKAPAHPRSRSPSPEPSPTLRHRYVFAKEGSKETNIDGALVPQRSLVHKVSRGSLKSTGSQDSKKQAPRHVHHHKKFHPEVSHRELFFDLIYVVVCIELGIYLNSNLTWEQIGYTFLLFFSFWLDWFHTNSINSCIRMTNPWIILLIIVIIGPLGLASHSISEGINKQSSSQEVGTLSQHRVAVSIFLLLPRLAFLTIYANIWLFTDMVHDSFPESRRRQSGIFCLGFITSTALCIAMATVENSRAVLGMWIALDAVEVLIYPIAALTIKPAQQWKVAPAFAKERDTLWVLLVLGESIISLGMYGKTKDSDYYINLFLGFFLIYSILRLFLLSQPSKSDIIHHALYGSAIWVFLRNLCMVLLSFGILCVGVSMKAVMLSSAEPYTRTNSFLLTSGVGIALFFMNMCRFTHIFIINDKDPLIYGMNYNAARGRLRRYAVWSVQAFMSLCIIPFGLTVGDDGSGLKAPELLAVLNAYVFIVGIVELAARPTLLEQELLLRMQTPVHLSDLMAGFKPGPPHISSLPPGPLTAGQRARARENWSRLFHGFAVIKYAEVKADTLHRYATNELLRPGIQLHHKESQLEVLFGQVVANAKAAELCRQLEARILRHSTSNLTASNSHLAGSRASSHSHLAASSLHLAASNPHLSASNSRLSGSYPHIPEAIADTDGAPEVKIIESEHLLGEAMV